MYSSVKKIIYTDILKYIEMQRSVPHASARFERFFWGCTFPPSSKIRIGKNWAPVFLPLSQQPPRFT